MNVLSWYNKQEEIGASIMESPQLYFKVVVIMIELSDFLMTTDLSQILF